MNVPRAQAGVVVWLHEPLWGIDPDNGDMFKSNRHVLYSTRIVQDSRLTSFIDDDGVVLGEWYTADIASFEWREPERPTAQVDADVTKTKTKKFSVGSVEWRADVKTRHPTAYTAWTPNEDDQVRAEFTRGDTIPSMARKQQRQPGGIRSRLVKLGLIDGPSGLVL